MSLAKIYDLRHGLSPAVGRTTIFSPSPTGHNQNRHRVAAAGTSRFRCSEHRSHESTCSGSRSVENCPGEFYRCEKARSDPARGLQTRLSMPIAEQPFHEQADCHVKHRQHSDHYQNPGHHFWVPRLIQSLVLPHNCTIARHLTPSVVDYPLSENPRFSVLRRGRSWLHYRRFQIWNEQNSTDQPVLRPTEWSKTFSRRLPNSYGRRTPLHMLQRRSQNFVAARNVLSGVSSATSKARANGLLTGKPSSLLKFLDVKVCGISKSKPAEGAR